MNQQTPDIYERITQQIIASIERGAKSFRMPWHITGAEKFAPINVASRKRYRGANVILLWLLAEHFGFESGEWGTYKQWKELGGQVRKDEKAAIVVFWKTFERTREQTNGDEESESNRGFIAKGYPIFNLAQVEGYTPKPVPVLPESERITVAEQFVANLGADIREEGSRACYSPSRDLILMPPFSRFREPAGYYSTLAHELTHWTGAPHRLNRDFQARFGLERYAMEELVAELGAAVLFSSLGLSNEPRESHADYINSWLRVLKQDKRAIFTAASQAQRAVDWMEQKSQEQQKPEAQPSKAA